MNYKLAYRIGFHPWEDAEEQRPFTETLGDLLEREESGASRPTDRRSTSAPAAGSGASSWQSGAGRSRASTSSRKPCGARAERLENADVDLRLVHGDVTALREAGVGSGFRLVLDTGTFHGLKSAQREAMGREVSAIAADDATVLMLAWAPRRRGPLPRGASRSEIEAAFPGWSATDLRATGFEAPKPVELLMKPDERWFRLRRV